MRFVSKTIFIPALIILLAGCDDASLEKARAEALRREAVALQQAQAERARREFWQGLTFVAGVGAVGLLIAGIAMGSSTRRANGTKP
jgi:hypothetical protein